MEHVGYNQNTIYASTYTQSYYNSTNTEKIAAKYILDVSIYPQQMVIDYVRVYQSKEINVLVSE